MKNKLPLIVISILVAFFYLKGIDTGKGYNDDTDNVNKSYGPVYGESDTSSDTNYRESSSSSESEIVSCPKCSKSYNKATWGSMCNSCWSDGKGLKSKGRNILE